MAIKVVTPVAVEPITLAELRAHLRLDTVGGVHPDDTMIQAQLIAAREFAEHYTGRMLAPVTLELALDAFPAGAIELTGSPVASITSIKYIDLAGTEQTLDPAAFSLNDYGIAAKVEMAYTTPWPATRDIANAVKVRYVAGYVAAPGIAKAAMLLLVGHLYENRQEATSLKVEQIPLGVKSLLNAIDAMAI